MHVTIVRDAQRSCIVKSKSGSPYLQEEKGLVFRVDTIVIVQLEQEVECYVLS